MSSINIDVKTANDNKSTEELTKVSLSRRKFKVDIELDGTETLGEIAEIILDKCGIDQLIDPYDVYAGSELPKEHIDCIKLSDFVGTEQTPPTRYHDESDFVKELLKYLNFLSDDIIALILDYTSTIIRLHFDKRPVTREYAVDDYQFVEEFLTPSFSNIEELKRAMLSCGALLTGDLIAYSLLELNQYSSEFNVEHVPPEIVGDDLSQILRSTCQARLYKEAIEQQGWKSRIAKDKKFCFLVRDVYCDDNMMCPLDNYLDTLSGCQQGYYDGKLTQQMKQSGLYRIHHQHFNPGEKIWLRYGQYSYHKENPEILGIRRYYFQDYQVLIYYINSKIYTSNQELYNYETYDFAKNYWNGQQSIVIMKPWSFKAKKDLRGYKSEIYDCSNFKYLGFQVNYDH